MKRSGQLDESEFASKPAIEFRTIEEGKNMSTTTYKAPTIHCDGCAASITRSLARISGVRTVEVDVATKQVTVEFDERQTSDLAIQERLELVGFPAEKAGA